MTKTIAIKKLLTFVSTSTNTLKRIWNPLWRILTYSPSDDFVWPKKTLCVSIEKGGLFTVFGSRLLSRIKIKGPRRYALEEDRYPQPESLASTAALALSELRASKADITLSIPKAWAIVKTVEFPSTVKEELSNVVSYELDRLTPFSPGDAYYDFSILKDNGEKISLVLIAAKIDTVKPYLDAFREKGITVSRVTVNLSGIGTLCSYRDKGKDFTIVEINKNGYEGALFLDGSLSETFTGTFTTNDESSKIDTLLGEVSPLHEAAQQQGRSPQMILLLKDRNPLLKELIKLKVNLPFKILDETDIKLKLPKQGEFSHAALGGVLESLWSKAKGLNLLKKGLYERPKTPVVLTLILTLAIIISGIIYMVAPLQIEEKRLKEIDNQITMRKEEVRKVEALKKEIETLGSEISTIKNFRFDRPMTQDVLRELTNVLPNNTWLTRVKITGTTVDIEGYAASATGLLPKLEASKYFRKAEFASPTFRDAKLNADRFIIKMEMEVTREVAQEPTKKGAQAEDEEE